MSGEPAMSGDGARAELTIDLGALADNWRKLAETAAGAECAAVVKADAYGVGAEPAVRALARAGCRTFFVAHAGEGARARAALGAGEGFRIFVLNGGALDAAGPSACAEHGLRPVLGSLAEIEAWGARGGGSPAALHIDTGMNRLGISSGDIDRALALAATGGFLFELAMSHFVSSEEPADPLNDRQIDAFRKAREKLPGVAASLANSSGIFLPQKPFFDLVRPGYALYGGNPLPGQPNPMRPVVRLMAPIIQLRDIAPGATVGYNGQWTAKRPTRLATIGVGYADGFPRNLMATESRAGGEAVVLGQRCRFAGRVSMDLIVIDVTDVRDTALAPGTPVELLSENIGVDDVGARAGTIGYEVLTSLGRRYRRRYIGGV